MRKNTKEVDYTERLQTLGGKKWKEILDVQRPYRWNLKRLNPGKTLEIGCGIGRLLEHLPKGSVGIDHNPHSVEECNKKGLTALQTSKFSKSKFAKKNTYDSILLAHVFEHLNQKDNIKLLNEYLPFLKKNGKLLIICPQEKGYTTDQTHVEFYDFSKIEKLIGKFGFVCDRKMSFPFPRSIGKIFTYNEFVVVAKKSNE